ncbi:GntR family transcriptional regulator [Streptomyces sp. NRRL S-646]|uniref:GntR family transcriptional regulator n=1 Tax=Streptomyces sp. NRRL S-646 TaxID=1463917 RepID=UPI0004C87612|nr:GntR family transcriptional regulator [Streptomyces sp. NRRL S-646]
MTGGTSTGERGGKEYDRVAAALRARITSGEYPLNGRLPSQRELADEFDVSRDTVQRVLRDLKSEHWIESRQGSGSRVIWKQRIHLPRSEKEPGHQVTLGELIAEAFEQSEVTLDVFTLTSESLGAHLRTQAERIQAGRISPQGIALRVLLPSESVEMPYWRTGDTTHDEVLKERYLDLRRRHTATLRTLVSDLRAMKLVPSVEFEIRHIGLVPYSKLYLVNKVQALEGPYEVYMRTFELDDGLEIEVPDVIGLGAGLTHYVKDDDPSSQGTEFVEKQQAWFASVWELFGH